jgi:epoxyqueuosine reductase QueG
MTDHGLTVQVRKLAREAGAALVGFADIEGLAPLPQAVVIAMRHSRAALTDPANMPNAVYQQEYADLNAKLTRIAEQIAERLRAAAWRAEANPATSHSLDVENLRAPFPHKTAATRSGLGWIGKSALLVTPEFGPAVRLASVLTDAPLAVGEPITAGGCGDCKVCVEACPGQAITGATWHAGEPRETLVDAQACYRTRTEAAVRNGIERPRCGVCMAVCPRRPR